MSQPWEFSINDESKVLIGFLGFFLVAGVIGVKGCSETTRESITKATLQAENDRTASSERTRMLTECIKAGNPVLECEKLK